MRAYKSPIAKHMQALMAVVLVFSCIVLGLHMYITRRFPAIPAAPLPEEGLFGKEVLNGGDTSPEPWRLSAAPGEVWLTVMLPKNMMYKVPQDSACH